MGDVRAPQSPVDRIAGAPISWGVCEVPDWGYPLVPSPVLAETPRSDWRQPSCVRRATPVRR